MTKATHRSAYACALALALAFAPRPARAADPVDARMQCERVSEPGRVRCFVELRAPAGRSIVWADVVIVQLPDLAAALKGRIGPADATTRDPSFFKLAFGLVARRMGRGEARARVRAVLCEGEGEGAPRERCVPESVEVRAPIDVGG